jgi:predicted SAM-dependent methyltransferase
MSRPYAGVFEKMTFPDYVYQEYPKMVQLKQPGPDGKPQYRVVHNQAEELRAIDEIVPVQNFDKVVEEKEELKEELQKAQEGLEALKKELAALKAEKSEVKPASPTLKVPKSE